MFAYAVEEFIKTEKMKGYKYCQEKREFPPVTVKKAYE